jgi:hypothetical protein
VTVAEVNQQTPSTWFRRALHLLGVDRAIGWTVAPRAWSVFAAPITLALVASHLSPDEQGFYYTFASIVALQVFFEMGLAFVVQQFASHEKAFLTWQPDGTIGGSGAEKGRLASLFRTALTWYGGASLLTILALLVGGTLFFLSQRTGVSGWQQPWITLSIIAGVALFLSPVFAVLEGCGVVAEVARVRAWQAVAANLAAWSTLLLGGRLWAAPAVYGSSLIIGAAWITAVQRHFLLDLLRTRGGRISWRAEVWPFQWRIALSWISGYLIFQLFTPVLFAYHGPSVAGRMGMSFTIISAMLTLAMSWLTTKVPLFGYRIARREFRELDKLFFPTAFRSVAAFALSCVAFFSAVLILRRIGHPWAARVLDPLPLGLLILATLANHIVFAEAVYLRAHKQEPLLMISVATAVLVGVSTLSLGRVGGATGMMIGFSIVTIVVSLCGSTAIFLRKRREWHR